MKDCKALTYESYLYALQRLFKNGEKEFRENLVEHQKGVVLTEKQRYFVHKLCLGLDHALGLTEEVANESIAWEIGKGLLTTAAAGLATRGVCSAILPFFGSALPNPDQLGNIVSISTAIIVGLFSSKNIKDKATAIHRAKKITAFLMNPDNSDEPYSIFDIIAFELCIEFRFAIEMLVKGDKGIDELIKFFIQRFFEVAAGVTEGELKKIKTMSERTDRIKNQLLELPQKNIPNTNLKLQNYDIDIDWTLRGIIKHAPILLCLPLEHDEIYQFRVYLNTADEKWSFQVTSIFQKISAEGSGKYPPRLVFSKDLVEFASGYTQSTEKLCCGNYVIPTFDGNNDIDDKIKIINDSEIVNQLASFYEKSRQLKVKPGKDNLLVVCEMYSKLCQDLLRQGKCSSIVTWFNLFTEIQLLRNMLYTVIKPIYLRIIEKEIMSLSFEEIEYQFQELSNRYLDNEKIDAVEDSINKGRYYFSDEIDDADMYEETETLDSLYETKGILLAALNK